MDLSAEERKTIEGMLATLGRLPLPRPPHKDEPSPEEKLAAFLLTEARQEVLCQGWHFNTAHTDCGLDEEGKSDLRNCNFNILQLLDSPPSVSLQGNILCYDAKPIPETVEVLAALDLEFKDLPLLCSRVVVLKASRNLQDRLMVSPTLHAFTERQEVEAYARLKQWEAERTAPNMLRTLITR